MKDFNDFIDILNPQTESDVSIYKRAADNMMQSFEETYDDSDDSTLQQAKLHGAIIDSMQQFSIELLEKYHHWLHDDNQ